MDLTKKRISKIISNTNQTRKKIILDDKKKKQKKYKHSMRHKRNINLKNKSLKFRKRNKRKANGHIELDGGSFLENFKLRKGKGSVYVDNSPNQPNSTEPVPETSATPVPETSATPVRALDTVISGPSDNGLNSIEIQEGLTTVPTSDSNSSKSKYWFKTPKTADEILIEEIKNNCKDTLKILNIIEKTEADYKTKIDKLLNEYIKLNEKFEAFDKKTKINEYDDYKKTEKELNDKKNKLFNLIDSYRSLSTDVDRVNIMVIPKIKGNVDDNKILNEDINTYISNITTKKDNVEQKIQSTISMLTSDKNVVISDYAKSEIFKYIPIRDIQKLFKKLGIEIVKPSEDLSSDMSDNDTSNTSKSIFKRKTDEEKLEEIIKEEYKDTTEVLNFIEEKKKEYETKITKILKEYDELNNKLNDNFDAFGKVEFEKTPEYTKIQKKINDKEVEMFDLIDSYRSLTIDFSHVIIKLKSIARQLGEKVEDETIAGATEESQDGGGLFRKSINIEDIKDTIKTMYNEANDLKKNIGETIDGFNNEKINEYIEANPNVKYVPITFLEKLYKKLNIISSSISNIPRPSMPKVSMPKDLSFFKRRAADIDVEGMAKERLADNDLAKLTSEKQQLEINLKELRTQNNVLMNQISKFDISKQNEKINTLMKKIDDLNQIIVKQQSQTRESSSEIPKSKSGLERGENVFSLMKTEDKGDYKLINITVAVPKYLNVNLASEGDSTLDYFNKFKIEAEAASKKNAEAAAAVAAAVAGKEGSAVVVEGEEVAGVAAPGSAVVIEGEEKEGEEEKQGEAVAGVAAPGSAVVIEGEEKEGEEEKQGEAVAGVAAPESAVVIEGEEEGVMPPPPPQSNPSGGGRSKISTKNKTKKYKNKK